MSLAFQGKLLQINTPEETIKAQKTPAPKGRRREGGKEVMIGGFC